MGEPRPLIEMAEVAEPEAGDPLAALVRHAADLRVEYDVTAGLARHERLVARLPAPAATASSHAAAWSSWSLVSAVAAAAIAAVVLAGPERTGAERREVEREGGRDRGVITDPGASKEAPGGSPTPRVSAVEVPAIAGDERRADERARAEDEAAVGGGSAAGAAAASARRAPADARAEARPRSAPSGRSPAEPRTPVADDDRIEREAAQIRTIRAALARRDAEAALSLCDEGDRAHPEGVFEAERQGLRVLALFELGRIDEARSLAERYLSANPSGSLAPRVRRVLAPESLPR